MEQRLSLLTLGVADVDRARRFYEALGWRAGLDVEETVFFQAGCLIVTLWGREKLAEDTGVTDNGGWGGIAPPPNVGAGREGGGGVEEARAAGATIAREPAETFYGGYSGVFVDLDGHSWEVAWNPGFPLADDGSI